MLPVTPEEKYRAVLNKYEEMENPPTFLFECLNGRQQREVMLFRQGMGTGTLADFDELYAQVESHLVGWENIEAEYTKGGLLDVVSYGECLELLALLAYQPPSVADKKKYKSPSPSGTETTAPPVQDPSSASEPSTGTAVGE